MEKQEQLLQILAERIANAKPGTNKPPLKYKIALAICFCLLGITAINYAQLKRENAALINDLYHPPSYNKNLHDMDRPTILPASSSAPTGDNTWTDSEFI